MADEAWWSELVAPRSFGWEDAAILSGGALFTAEKTVQHLPYAAEFGLYTEAEQTAARIYKRLRKRNRDPDPRDYDLVSVRKRLFSTMNIGEHTRRRYRRGRKKAMLAKKINSVVEPIYVRFQGINQYMTAAAGYFKLFNHKNSGTGGVDPTVVRAPVHLWDITAFLNNQNGALAYATLGYNLMFSNTAGATFTNLAGVTNDASSTTQTWTIEQTGHVSTSVALAPHKRSILEWVDMRLLCYGRSNLPTRWRVALIQILDDSFHPNEVLLDGPPIVDSGPYNEFYNALAAPFMNNPIDATGNNALNGKIKFLHKEDFILQSQSTVDGVATNIPRVHEIRGFHRLNRTQNYDYRVPVAENVYGNFTAPGALDNKWVTSNAQYAVHVTPKARIYLMVGGQATSTLSAVTPAVAPTFTTADHPSYDLFLRAKHLVDD